MRFESIRAKGVGPFREEIAIDLGSISGRLVAVCGGNGQGKSTLLELLAGALYRQCPTRGALASLATSRDAFVEVDVVNGARHRLRHVLDSVSGKGESVVTDESGRPLVASAKLREFDTWAAKHLPSPEVLYASTFAAQGSGGFLEMKAGERKAVLLRVLGIERLEALAEKAREHVRSSKTALSILDARVADERARASDPIAVAGEVDELVAKKAAAEAALIAARSAYEVARAAEEAARAVQKAIVETQRRRAELFKRLEEAKTRRADVEKRLQNNQGVIESADAIREAVSTAKDLDGTIASLAAELSAAHVDLAAAERELDTASATHSEFETREEAVDERAARVRRVLGEKDSVVAAQAAVGKLRDELEERESLVSQNELEIENQQELALTGAGQRVEQLRAGLQPIADGGAENPRALAAETLRADDEAADTAREAPRRVEWARERLAEHRVALTAVRLKLAAAEKTAARAKEIAQAEAEIVAIDAERAQIVEAREAKRGEIAALSLRAQDLLKVVGRLEKTNEERVATRQRIDHHVKLAERLAQAEARIAELEPQRAALDEGIAKLSADFDAIAVESEPPMPDVTGARGRADAADAALRGIESAIAVKETQLAAARESEKRLSKMKTDRRAAEDELADWTRLAEDLGRDGLQALEIDAAGPELTELVNDLLQTCVGSRWTVTIEASRLSSDGKKQLEGCEVRVLDTERGREGSAESLSGGERVLVGEAVSLALSMLACRRSGVQGPTLVRDESGAALDPVNARAYVAMLRRAADIVGASKVLYVAHNPELQEMADARICIRDGRVSVTA